LSCLQALKDRGRSPDGYGGVRFSRHRGRLGGQVVRQAVERFADGQDWVRISEKGNDSHQAASIRAATDDFPNGHLAETPE
jgi:hypothetical protein